MNFFDNFNLSDIQKLNFRVHMDRRITSICSSVLSIDNFNVKVYNGLCSDNEQIAKLGKNERILVLDKATQINELYHSTTMAMTIKLRVHKSYNYTGFSMFYKAVCKKSNF